jgi:hypothetical protein
MSVDAPDIIMTRKVNHVAERREAAETPIRGIDSRVKNDFRGLSDISSRHETGDIPYQQSTLSSKFSPDPTREGHAEPEF